MTTGTIGTGNVPLHLVEGLDDTFGQEYEAFPKQFDKIFSTKSSRKKFETVSQFEGFSLAPVKTEADSIAYDSATEGIAPKYNHLVYAKGFIVSEEALEDELYGLFNQKAGMLAFSLAQTEEVVGANVLNNGFDANFTMPGGDGLSLFSLVHPNGPTDSGTSSNRLTIDSDLTESTLEDMLIQIREATDTRGLRIAQQPVRLIIPPSLMFDAERILKSALQNDTANNATNAMKMMNMLPGGFAINDFLTDNDAWFVKTNARVGLTHYERRSARFQQDGEFNTSSTRFKASKRFSFGWGDFRGAYGTPGSQLVGLTSEVGA